MVLGRSSSRDRPHTLLACQDGSPQPQATAPRLRSGSWPSLQHTPGRTGQRSGWPAWVRAPAVHGSSPCGVERGAGMGVSRLPCPPSVLHWGQAWPGCWALCRQPQARQHMPSTLTAQGSAWARRRGGCTVYTGRHGRLGWPGSPGQTAGRPRAAAGSPSALQGPRAVRVRGAGTGPPSSAPPMPQHTLQEAGHVLQLRDAVFPVAAEPLQQLEGFQMLPAGVGSVEAPEGGVHLLPAGEGLRACPQVATPAPHPDLCACSRRPPGPRESLFTPSGRSCSRPLPHPRGFWGALPALHPQVLLQPLSPGPHQVAFSSAVYSTRGIGSPLQRGSAVSQSPWGEWG